MQKVELDDLFARAEIITLHTPSTETTRGMLGVKAFAKMRDGVLIVNCARGELVVEADLKTAIESGKVGGAALDVFPQEPPDEFSLFRYDAGYRNASPWCCDNRGARESSITDRATDVGLFGLRCGSECTQYAIRLG